jgi:hypothetical protein
MIKYKTLILRTIEDVRKAERLKATGWHIGNIGFDSIQFFKKEVTSCHKLNQKSVSE